MVRGLIIGEGGMSGVKRELWWEVVSVGDCADCGEVCVWGGKRCECGYCGYLSLEWGSMLIGQESGEGGEEDEGLLVWKYMVKSCDIGGGCECRRVVICCVNFGS